MTPGTAPSAVPGGTGGTPRTGTGQGTGTPGAPGTGAGTGTPGAPGTGAGAGTGAQGSQGATNEANNAANQGNNNANNAANQGNNNANNDSSQGASPEAGGEAGASSAISMHGDFFGNGHQTLTISFPSTLVAQPPVVVPPSTRTETFTLTPSLQGAINSGTNQHVVFTSSAPVQLAGVPVAGSPSFTSVQSFNVPTFGTFQLPPSLVVTPNGLTQQNLTAAAATQALPGELPPTFTAATAAPIGPTTGQPSPLPPPPPLPPPAPLPPPTPAVAAAPAPLAPAFAPFTATSPVNVTYQYTNPGTTITPPPVAIQQPSISLFLPSTASGAGLVGLNKVSENNSPLPRDRLIFEYDLYNNVPLSAAGINVNRFATGFEKTFFDRRASFALRLPFAATLSSDIQADGVTSQSAVLGDLFLVLKGLAYRSNTLFAGGGLAIDLPTANSIRVFAGDTPLIKIPNQSVLLTPYCAFLWAPANGKLFFQNWYQFTFDTNGNPVQANLFSDGLQNVGRIHQQTLMQIDAQLGYWGYRSANPSALLNRLAPFLELHSNSTISKAQTVDAGPFLIGQTSPLFSELNCSFGVLAQIHNTFLLTVGGGVPLLGGNSRTFDFQFGIRGSLLFGPTARNITRATPVSGF